MKDKNLFEDFDGSRPLILHRPRRNRPAEQREQFAAALDAYAPADFGSLAREAPAGHMDSTTSASKGVSKSGNWKI
jgi:hypothetical protein